MRSICRISTWHVLGLLAAIAARPLSAQEESAANSETVIGKIEGINEHGGVASVAFAPSGKLLVSAGTTFDPILRFWDPESVQEQRTSDGGHTGGVVLAFSKDGVLVSADGNGTLVVWDAAYAAPKWKTKPTDYDFGDIAISPDSSKIATAATIIGLVQTSYELAIWDVAMEQKLITKTDFESFLRCVAFSPDGKLLACACDSNGLNGELRVYEVATGKLRWSQPKAHHNAIEGLEFAPIGDVLASGSSDETIKLWKATTGRELAVLEGTKAFVNDVAFSPNGKLLASVGEDNHVRLWSVPDGRPLKTLAGHTKEVNCVAFSPDGSRIASGSYDHTVRVWPISTGKQNRPTPPKERPAGAAPAAAFRKWKSADGTYSVEARLVRFTAGEVELERRDKKIVKVALEKLSTADQAYVQSRPSGND